MADKPARIEKTAVKTAIIIACCLGETEFIDFNLLAGKYTLLHNNVWKS